MHHTSSHLERQYLTVERFARRRPSRRRRMSVSVHVALRDIIEQPHAPDLRTAAVLLIVAACEPGAGPQSTAVEAVWSALGREGGQTALGACMTLAAPPGTFGRHGAAIFEQRLSRLPLRVAIDMLAEVLRCEPAYQAVRRAWFRSCMSRLDDSYPTLLPEMATIVAVRSLVGAPDAALRVAAELDAADNLDAPEIARAALLLA